MQIFKIVNGYEQVYMYVWKNKKINIERHLVALHCMSNVSLAEFQLFIA